MRTIARKRKGLKLIASREHKLGYFLLNLLFGTIIFVVGYFLFISQMDHNFEQLIYILIWNTIAGVFASFLCRVLMQYWDFDKTFNFYMRSMFVTLISSLMIWFGLYASLFQRYEINVSGFIAFWNLVITRPFWEFIVIFFFLKGLVFFASDYFADKVAFGG